MKDQTVRTGYIFSRFLTLVANRKVFQLVDYETGIINVLDLLFRRNY